MGYTPTFQPMYEGGWEDLPLETTPIQAEALNNYDEAIENIEEYLASDESQANLADAYDATETYSEGDYRIHNGTLYKCLEDIDEPEEWDSTKWESCLITDEMGHGGGGSDVSITPTLSTGTKIADFEIDGERGSLYAPTGGGGNANIWTGTQAELEEVFDELEEGTQINITDDEQEVVEGGTIYSEEEQVIGLWTNNKPLYQKTIDCGTLPNNTTKTVAHGVSNIEHIQILDASAKNTNTGLTLPLPYISTTNINQTVKVYCNDTNIYLETAIDYSAYTKSNVTIQYTKTTDAPIDVVVGKSTMYIASSDCYSTEEKEIGCWTDGKPLYQRTFFVTGSYSGSGYVDLGLTNIDTIWLHSAFFNDDSSNILPLPFPHPLSESTRGVFIDDQHRLAYRTLQNGVFINPVVTIRYTKTTDTAGSGQYTPASGKAIHYSTDEQVIGTWIDGKTIYRKVVKYTGTYYGETSVSLDTGLTNVSEILPTTNISAINNTDAYTPLPYVHSNPAYNAGYFISSDFTKLNLRMGTSYTSSSYLKQVIAIYEYTKSS